MFAESPVMRADRIATEAEVNAASQEIGTRFPEDYREFLLRYGGAMVGPYPVFGLHPSDVMEDDRWSVVDVTNEVRSSGLDGISNWIVFSEDHAGNPIGMDPDGKVWIYDHDFGGVAELAQTFEEYIRTQCLKLPT
jgi:cell wall assembly regulator SMI1